MAQQAGAEPSAAHLIGEQVLLRRRRLQMDQVTLAKKATEEGVKVERWTVSRIETGDRLPTWNELLAISLALEADPVALGAREEDYPELRLTRRLIEHIRCSRRKRRDLGGRQAPLLVVARART